MTRAPVEGSRRLPEAGRLDRRPPGGPEGGNSPESLTRGQKILIAMLAGMLGSGAAGYFSLNATMNANFAAVNSTMNANFTAVNGHLLSLQEQIGRLDARIARVEALFEAGLTPVAPRSSPAGKPGSPPGP